MSATIPNSSRKSAGNKENQGAAPAKGKKGAKVSETTIPEEEEVEVVGGDDDFESTGPQLLKTLEVM